MEAGRQTAGKTSSKETSGKKNSNGQRLLHALGITVGLYLATLPTTLPAINQSPSRMESIEIPASKIYLIQEFSQRLACNSDRILLIW